MDVADVCSLSLRDKNDLVSCCAILHLESNDISKVMIKHNSMYNTGPTFPIFIVKEYAKFLLDTGGMKVWEQMTKEKAQMIYNTIDESKGFYTNEVYPKHRSRLNIPFRI